MDDNSSKEERIFKYGFNWKSILGLLKKSLVAKVIFGLFLVFLFVVVFELYLMVSLQTEMNRIDDLKGYMFTSRATIFSSDGKLIAELTEGRREYAPLSKIPDDLINATIAIEDSRFYSHRGIDFEGIARAVVSNIKAGAKREGGSTITQQLAKSLFLSPSKKIIRKIKEVILSMKIEKVYTKHEILECYFNQIYYGSGAYGVQAASKMLFRKDVNRLTLAECALLAGIPSNPSYYSPIRHPDNARRRQQKVLKRMVEFGYAEKKSAERSVREFWTGYSPPEVVFTGVKYEVAPYFVEYIRQRLAAEYDNDAIFRGGLRVYTTLDLNMQRTGEKILSRHLKAINRRLGDTEVEGALVAIDAHSGRVLAMVGGSGYTHENQLNRVVQAKRQPGSAFKPFVYAVAVERKFQPNHIIDDKPVKYKVGDTEEWRPRNDDWQSHGKVTMRRAIQKSYNIPAVKILEVVGIDALIEMARRMGIASPLKKTMSLCLGTSEVTPLELTSAYIPFANAGFKVSPSAIDRIVNTEGEVLYELKQKPQKVLSPQVAFIMAHLLRGVIQHGTAYDPVGSRFFQPAGGKTGTTDDYADAWFIGFTTEMVVGVWIGHDKGRKTLGGGETGSRMAGPIWADFMLEVTKNKKLSDFEVPGGIVFKWIDSGNGKLASPPCPRRTYESFMEGYEPAQYCNELHPPEVEDTGVVSPDGNDTGPEADEKKQDN